MTTKGLPVAMPLPGGAAPDWSVGSGASGSLTAGSLAAADGSSDVVAAPSPAELLPELQAARPSSRAGRKIWKTMRWDKDMKPLSG